MAEVPGAPDATFPPRPVPATYWVVPGRLLVGEYPGSPSRTDAMERLRRFLTAGVTCFVDLTEPGELPPYEPLLPFATPDGRRIEYLREPIRDHGVPAGPEPVARAIAGIDDALGAGHVVYLHCRAGIGRSATVAACWMAGRAGVPPDPLERLQVLWRQSERSRRWPQVPETEEQVEFVHSWSEHVRRSGGGAKSSAAGKNLEDRVRGALLGLALGDAAGAAAQSAQSTAGEWTQHTALALCFVESLLDKGRCDARDQIERYLAWQRDGHGSANGSPGDATPDVARALATYQWRKLPMAGSHDPKDGSTASLPRAVGAAAYALSDPAAAVELAAAGSRTTHQSPVVLDACRYYAAMLVGALRGDARAAICDGIYEPVAGLWQPRPIRPELADALTAPQEASNHARGGDVVTAVVAVRTAVAGASDAADAIERSVRASRDPALDGALAGALAGALWGATALPAGAVRALARLDLLERSAERLASRQRGLVGPAPTVRG